MRAQIEQLCPACKAAVSAGSRFCRKCGTSLNATSIGSQPIATRPSSGADERGLAMINEALELTERTGEQVALAEIWRLKGEVVLMQGENAERCFREALEVARAQEAKW